MNNKKFPDLIDGTRTIGAQTFLNGEVHDWYRIILGYTDHLVASLLDQMQIHPGQRVLDPFCGTGTTLIECMKREILSVGVDANPSSCFAAKVKTCWKVTEQKIQFYFDKVETTYREKIADRSKLREDVTYLYLQDSGMLDRKWISNQPLLKSLAIKSAIKGLDAPPRYKHFLMLALIAEVVGGASNVKFGPELYCGDEKVNHDVLKGFTNRVRSMISDLQKTSGLKAQKTRVIHGDSRFCESVKGIGQFGKFHAIITSPPYPTEHDYTRNARLELAFLENVTDRDSLRVIKRGMIRSNTKGIYSEDNEGKRVANYKRINQLTRALERKGKDNTDGFARLYPKVLQEYFGGMKGHLESVGPHLRKRGTCAYIVGDQSSYLQVHIPTAEILASIASRVGFKVLGIKHWRTRWSTARARSINENILLLQKK